MRFACLALLTILSTCLLAEEPEENPANDGLSKLLKKATDTAKRTTGGSVKEKDKSKKSTSTAITEILSSEEITKGLREALAKGIKSAIGELGKPDGFFANIEVKIPVPESLTQVEKGMRLVGQDKKVDEFILTMNRAAEQAVPEVVEIFGNAIAAMSVEDAKSILKGSDDAATKYFKKSSETQLVEKIRPIVVKATDAAGVTANYKKLVKHADFATKALGKEKEFDIETYVTQKALDGLFTMIAKEEKQIRQNPAARTTDLLQRVFGALK